MSVDKFGRFSQRYKNKEDYSKKFNTVLTVDHDNNLNAHFTRIKNLKDPKFNEDAATKNFVTNSLNEYKTTIDTSIKGCEDRWNKEFEIIYQKIKFVEQYCDTQITEHSKYFEKRVNELESNLNSINNIIYEYKVKTDGPDDENININFSS